MNKCQTEFILPKKVKSNKQILWDKLKIFGNHIDYIHMRWLRIFFPRFIFGHWFAWNGFFSFPIWNCCVVCAYFCMWFLYTLTLLTDKMRSRVSQSVLSVCFFSLAQFLAIDFVRWAIFGTRHIFSELEMIWVYAVCMCQCALHGTFFGRLWDIDNLSSVAAGLLATTNTNYFSHFNQSISKTDVSI